MAIGMSYSQFWDGDPEIATMFRKAFDVKQDMDNQAAWLQGMYFYEALCDVAPIMRAFSKATRAHKYPAEPFDIKSSVSESRQEAKEKAQYQKNKTKMESFMSQFNQSFKGKLVSTNAGNGNERDQV